MKRTSIAATVLCCMLLAACAGTTTSGTPLPIPNGDKVKTWVEPAPVGPGKSIWFQNLTNVPVLITSITLYDCSNVMGGCETVHPDNLIVRPQESVSGYTVLPSDAHSAFSFRWKFISRLQPVGYEVNPGVHP